MRLFLVVQEIINLLFFQPRKRQAYKCLSCSLRIIAQAELKIMEGELTFYGFIPSQ